MTRFSLAAIVLATVMAASQAINLPAGFSKETLLYDLDTPIDIEFRPDGRALVAENYG
jgi:hypothetical protein